MSVDDRFLLHCRDPQNWRLRNFEEHPFDPGWEVGTYSYCHERIRALTDPKAKIIDVVVKDGKAVVRSAFVVERTQGSGPKRVLHFDHFYFADGDPMELPGPYIQYRCMKLETFLGKYDLKNLWRKITKYADYKKGQKPRSIDSQSWKAMIEETSRIRRQQVRRKTVCLKTVRGRCK